MTKEEFIGVVNGITHNAGNGPYMVSFARKKKGRFPRKLKKRISKTSLMYRMVRNKGFGDSVKSLFDNTFGKMSPIEYLTRGK